MPRRHRKMRGGFLDSLTQGLSDAWNKTKSAASGAYSSVSSPSSSTSYTPTTTTPSYTPTTSTSYTPTTTSYSPTSASYGGRKRTRRHRKMRGGYSDNTPLTGLAASASPIKGGRSKRRSRRSRK